MISTKKVGDDQAFITRSGERLYSIQELTTYMRRMSSDEFSHHVNNERNDFANWISAVFKQKSLAKKLSDSQYDTLAVLTEATTPPAKKVSVKKTTPKKKVSRTPQKKSVPTKKVLTKKTSKKPVVQVKKRALFERNPNVKTEEDEIESKRLNIHEQIEHLENQTKHLTKYHKNTNREPLSDKDVDIKEHLVDFTLGLIIGLVLGFVLAKSLGLFA